MPADNRLFAEGLAVLYLKYAERFGIRADLAWAQMLLETNGLRFTGKVQSQQHNYCGLKTADGAGFASFATPELGVIAHFAHLSWYAYPEHVNDLCSFVYDPRHKTAHANTAKVLSDLSGKWATTKTYAEKILRVWNEGV